MTGRSKSRFIPFRKSGRLRRRGGERRIIATFLEGVGRHKPQVVGYNSARVDLKVLVQRAVVNGLSIPGFARRPDKPWEGADYFSAASDWNVDMMQIVGGQQVNPLAQ